MRYAKICVLPAGCVLFLFALILFNGALNLSLASGEASPTDVSGQAPSQYIDFLWAFAVLSDRDGKADVQPIVPDMVLKSGDRIKMMVQLRRKCFVYLFHDDQKNGVKLLFPYAFEQFDRDYRPERKYYIPGEAWFRLDENPGRELFYLIASAKRLDELEKAYLRYESAGEPLKADTAKALVDKIGQLRREHRELNSPAERPIPIGGALRGVEAGQDPAGFDIAAFAEQVLSTGFVARTYAIEHK
jgi:hypothetical protein